MTKLKNKDWDREYKERLSEEVFEFLSYDHNLIEYLSDHHFIWVGYKDKLASQLSDNSVSVLPICKLFEGALKLIAKKADWFQEFNNDKEPYSIRGFYRSNRQNIEAKIDTLSISGSDKQDAKDKFFSVINDFQDRNDALHSGTLLASGEINNYDSILTKIKEIVSLCLKLELISIGEPEMVSSGTGTVFKKK